MNELLMPKPPLPEPLSGSDTGSFAHSTVTRRFPKIARETMQDNEFSREVNQQLEQLMDDIPYKPLRELNDPGAPDIKSWGDNLQPFIGKNWLEVPWFVAEMYFYRRILEAIGFHQPGAFQGYDPFHLQKKRVLEAASSSTTNLAALLDKSLSEGQTGSTNWRADLQQLLVLNVWGNQADLSMWSAGEERPEHKASGDQQTHLLVNDAGQVAELLSTGAGQLGLVDFILDNYGPELIHDIGLADFLLTMDLAGAVRFHAKPAPHYVSDAMIVDVHSTLEFLASHQELAVRQLAQRVENHIQGRRLELVDDYFWTSPTYFWNMPGYVVDELSGSDLVISKGDANYRRLAGDLNWSPTTPFRDVVGYFPTALLALRVLKAELALGLSPSRVRQLENQDPDWKVNGQWAVIQLWEK
jgi:hypothetical protein